MTTTEVTFDTAVERFSLFHDSDTIGAPESRYRDLIPLGRPSAGEQYGFEVDLDACTGCKACVAACHSLNGLDADESWRSVGLLVGTAPSSPFQQVVTTACHHCVDPGCMKGCPVDAYEKDPVTGIVKHLDDQCIGCGYCTLTCPYEVPRFNERRGIVRKCDMCSDRLAIGEPPACVQACPNSAIRITTLATATAAQRALEEPFLPGAPDPRLTIPTTRYLSKKPVVLGAQPADYSAVKPAHGHPPLALMLVLTQLAVGAWSAIVALRLSARAASAVGLYDRIGHSLALVVLVATVLGLGASVSHLGRPRFAFRAALGFRHSWLSREIVVFGAFCACSVLLAAGSVGLDPGRMVGALIGHTAGATVDPGVLALGLATGMAGVTCSVMIYAATGKRWWRGPVTGTKFALTCATSGLAAVLAVALASTALGSGQAGRPLAELVRIAAVLLALSVSLKLAFEAALFRHRKAQELGDLARTARLLLGPLRRMTGLRFATAVAGGVVVPIVIAVGAGTAAIDSPFGAALAMVGLAAVLTGDLVERLGFFLAVASPRMPGGIG